MTVRYRTSVCFFYDVIIFIVNRYRFIFNVDTSILPHPRSKEFITVWMDTY